MAENTIEGKVREINELFQDMVSKVVDIVPGRHFFFVVAADDEYVCAVTSFKSTEEGLEAINELFKHTKASSKERIDVTKIRKH